MTTDQAVARLLARADLLREEGHHAAAHDWQRMADEMRRLAAEAERLPRARKPTTGARRLPR